MEKNNEFLEKLVHINRITKVVKGGRRFGFSALVVVGNQNGKIGVAHAKAKQVPDAIKKANDLAKRNLVHVPLREGRTIHHDIFGKDGAGKIKLNSKLKMNKTKMRVGRGIGSGKGKTSGRGVKGQKSRSGVAIKSFEGGQMPLYRRLPKRGFNSISKKEIAILNLEQIQSFIDKNNFKSSDLLNSELLKKLKLINKNSKKIKILGNGEIKEKINIEADLVSKSALKKLEKIGSSIQLKK